MSVRRNPEAIVVIDRLDRDRTKVVEVLRALMVHRERVDLVCLATDGTGPRALVGWRRSRGLRIHDLPLEALGHDPGTMLRPVERADSSVDGARDTMWAAAARVPMLGGLKRPGPAVDRRDSGPSVLYRAGPNAVVRERSDINGRIYQRDVLDPSGDVGIVCWVDRDEERTTSLLVFDHAVQRATRRSHVQWTAEEIASTRKPSVPVVAADEFGDDVVRALPKSWCVVPSDVARSEMRKALTGTEGVS